MLSLFSCRTPASVFIRWLRAPLAGVILLVVGTVVLGAQEAETPPPEDEAVESQLAEWRAILMFGINSEVEDVLPDLRTNRILDLADEVVALIEQSESTGVLTEGFTYLSALELGGGEDRAWELVVDNRNRGSEIVRSALNYLLTREGELDEEARLALTRLALAGTPTTSVPAVRLLGHAGLPREDLIEIYRDEDASEDVRGEVLLELGKREDAEAFEFIAEIIGEDEEATTNLQRYAIDTLGRLGLEEALPIILRQFDSDDALTRAYAVSALTRFETEEADQALVGALRDEFWRVRVAALEAIAERELDDALAAVMYRARRDPERPVRMAAIDTLAALDADDGWELLRERLVSDRVALDERSKIADVAITQKLNSFEDTLLEVIEDEWERENSRLLDAIGRLVSTSEVRGLDEIITRLMQHPNFIIQIYAVRAAGRQEIAALREDVEARTAEGQHRALRSAALAALEQM